MDRNQVITEITAAILYHSSLSVATPAAREMVRGFLKMNDDELGSMHIVVVKHRENKAYDELAEAAREFLRIAAENGDFEDHDDIGAQGHDEDTCTLCKLRALVNQRPNCCTFHRTGGPTHHHCGDDNAIVWRARLDRDINRRFGGGRA